MPTAVQRGTALCVSFLAGCACMYIALGPGKGQTSVKGVVSPPPGRAGPAIPVEVAPMAPPERASDTTVSQSGSSSSSRVPPAPVPTSNPMKDMECAVHKQWSCLGVPFHRECGILMGYHSDEESSTQDLMEQVKSIRSMPYFDKIRIGLVTNLDVVPRDVERAFSPIVQDAAMPSAAPYEVLDRAPFQRSMYFNRSARVWVRIVAPMHFAMDLLQFHDVLMSQAPKWDSGDRYTTEMGYQTGVIMARTDSKCVKGFLANWRRLAAEEKQRQPSPRRPPWKGADDLVPLQDAIRSSFIRLMPFPPEFCLNDVLGKDECVDWKRRWKGLNARCDVYAGHPMPK